MAGPQRRELGLELANGVLCIGRDGYLSKAATLKTICEDAAHVAGALREESLEEVGTDGKADAAKDPDADDPALEAALSEVDGESPVNAIAARTAFTAYLRRSPATIWGALRFAVLTLVLNVPGVALPVTLIAAGEYAPLAAIEIVVIGIVFFFSFRSRVRKNSVRYAAEAFYRAYARDRELRPEEPLAFAASHAEAKLPFKPSHVFTGILPGGASGSLIISGDGSKRSDRIAVVAGPRGPLAEAELRADPPALSAEDLDVYAELRRRNRRDAGSILSGAQVFIAGNSSTSRRLLAPVSIITRRSIPSPTPPVGGIPCSSASTNASS